MVECWKIPVCMLHVTGGVAVNQIISSPSHVRFAEELDYLFFLLSDTSLLKHSQYLYIVIAFPVYIEMYSFIVAAKL